MLSLYIHIPYCAYKCAYCSFMVIPEDNLDKDQREAHKDKYLTRLLDENETRSKELTETPIKTIHIGWGTPFQFGTWRLKKLIATVLETWNTEFLEELTIELNPDPIDEVLAFIKEMNELYPQLYRVRYSFGIQSFDDEVLSKTKRQYSFEELQWFLRALMPLKKHNVCFNADFIAFGKMLKTDDGDEVLRGAEKLTFFLDMVNSALFDGFSIYTLEIIPGSDWFNEAQSTAKAAQSLYGGDEAIMHEFHLLSKIVMNSGYRRYELSNFAKMGKGSIHNMVYWTDQSYLWLWINSSSYFNKRFMEQHSEKVQKASAHITTTNPIRFKNTVHWKEYQAEEWDSIDVESIEAIDEKTTLWEKAVMQLRCWIVHNISEYQSIMEKDFDQKVEEYIQQNRLLLEDDTLIITSAGYDVFNRIVTDLFV